MYSVLSLRRQGLASLGRRAAGGAGQELEAVAAGLPLESVLDELASAVAARAEDADGEQAVRLRETVDRLTAVATKADGWRAVHLRSARQDPLSGLANRSLLLDTARSALALGGAVQFVDVDRFNEVNVRGKHAVGDQLLVRLADRLRRHVEGSCRGPWSAS